MLSFFKNLKLNVKIALLGSGSVLITAAALVSIVLWQSGQYNKLAQREVDELIDSDLNHITEGVYNLIKTENEAAQDRINSNLSIAHYILESSGGLSQSSEYVTWVVSNQFTNTTRKIRIPRISIGGRWLDYNTDPAVVSPIVDKVTRLVGGTATIFHRMNETGDMLRIATSITGADAKRLVGSYLPATDSDGKLNPVIETVLKGKTFRGRAFVVNEWYLTAYEPLRNNDGKIVGMMYVGIKQKEIELRVRKAIIDIQLGKTGYVYVISGKGPKRGTYVISQKGERDGENIWETKDSDGRYVIKEIISKATGSKPGELSTERYRWQNPGETAPRWKVARLAYYAPLDWVIGASVYEDELETYREVLSSGRLRMMNIMVIAASIIILLIGIVGIVIAWTIARPVMQLKGAVEAVIKGDLDQVLPIDSSDEIGVLAQSFNTMTGTLKQTLAELQQILGERLESEGRLKMAEEMSHLGSWSLDLLNNRLTWSDEVYRIFGFEPQAFAPNYEAFLKLVHPDDREAVAAAYSESLLGDKDCYDMEHRIIKNQTGEVRIVHEKCLHFRDISGKVVKSTGMLHDITNRKRTEEALEKRILALTRPLEDPLSIAFEDMFNLDDIQRLQDEFAQATGVASIITHPDGTPITKPSNFCRLCNDIIRKTDKGLANCYKSDAALGRFSQNGPTIKTCMSGGLWDAGAGISVGGRHIANWLIGQVRDDTQTEDKMYEYAREIRTDEVAFIEAFREVPAMSSEQFQKIATVLYTLANQLSTTAYQNVQQARFIAERKQMENELQLLNSELEKRVSLRTAELERLNTELESFCYSISHEIRAPIARLEGFSKAISECIATSEMAPISHFAERTVIASQRLRSVIDALLMKNRLLRAEMSIEKVDLSEICHRIMEELMEETGERKVQVKISPNVTAEADRPMIELCLYNLLANALKFTSKSAEAVVEFGINLEPGLATYFVRDNGAGFEMEFADKLFQPFCRLHKEDEFEGSGIGLAIAHQIIERHKGKIWAVSSPDNGATFYFTLGNCPKVSDD